MRKNFNTYALSQGITRCMWFPFEGFAYIIQFQMESFGSQIAGNMSFSQNFTPLIPIPAHCQKVFFYFLFAKMGTLYFLRRFFLHGFDVYQKRNSRLQTLSIRCYCLSWDESYFHSHSPALKWICFLLIFRMCSPRPLCTNTFSTSNPAASKTILKPDAF